ncbi:MAG: thioesterase family protein [Syntrophomonadaceae bacterium]|jgi:acyl-CoA thioester hydrolase|nr:thioesterase family protein [Syntrophomonadaceae bacterium]
MEHLTTLTVRYAETDRMGFAHHSNHIVWWELARTELLRAIGVPYSEMESTGVGCPVLEIHCRYRQPAYYEDQLVVRTHIAEMTPLRIRFAYVIVKAASGALVASGESLHAFTDIASGRPLRLDRRHPELWQRLQSGGERYLAASEG